MISPSLLDQTLLRFPLLDREQIAVEPLEKGGSGRKYYRITSNGKNPLIVVQYTSQREENRHFCDIASFMRELGVRVPGIYHHDPEAGLIWMEDLGAVDLWHFRGAAWPKRQTLYRQTLEQAVTLHTRGHRALAGEIPCATRPVFQQAFDADLYCWEQHYFFENCLGRHFGIQAEAALHEFHGLHETLGLIAAALAARPRVLVHRDFQSQNVMIPQGQTRQLRQTPETPEPTETAALIDFQGMRPGLGEYDLASLLYDPYVCLAPTERESLLEDYARLRAQAGQAVAPDFREVFDLCAMQRLMQALGAYGFLGIVQEKPRFLDHIPTALASLREVTARLATVPGLGGLNALNRLLERLADPA